MFGAEGTRLSPPPLVLPVTAPCFGACRAARQPACPSRAAAPGEPPRGGSGTGRGGSEIPRRRQGAPPPSGPAHCAAAMSELALEELSALAAIYCEPDACEVLAVSGEGGGRAAVPRAAGRSARPGLAALPSRDPARPELVPLPRPGGPALRGCCGGSARRQRRGNRWLLAAAPQMGAACAPCCVCAAGLCRGQVPAGSTRS